MERTVPYNRFVAVTPSDTIAIPSGSTHGIYVGGTGNLVAVMENGQTATFSGIPAGTVLPIRVVRVNATLTTATLILALYVM